MLLRATLPLSATDILLRYAVPIGMTVKLLPNNDVGLLELDKILTSCGCPKKKDLYNLFLEDLLRIRRPELYGREIVQEDIDALRQTLINEDPENVGVWVFYPWLNGAYLCPAETIYHEVVTARNKTLVSHEEQRAFYNYNVGVAGLSIGSSAVATIARGGGARRIKIADSDVIDPSNLNRLRFGLPSIGQKKSEVIAHHIYETNPYHRIIEYGDISVDNVDSFFDKGFKLDVVIDACDTFSVKILLREAAKKRKIPVVMATDLGDGVLLDVERYDKKPDTEPFGGRLAGVQDKNNFMELALAVISKENIRPRVLGAMSEIGKSIPTHPQLGNAAYLSGVVISYIVRCLATNKPLIDNRVLIDLDDFFIRKL